MPVFLEGNTVGTSELLNLLNSCKRHGEFLREIIRACKNDSSLVSARFCMLEKISVQGRNVVFFENLESAKESEWVVNSRNSDLVLLHECTLMHVAPMLVSQKSVGLACELSDFLSEQGGDVNAFATQRYVKKTSVIRPRMSELGRRTSTFFAVESECKTPIFYAIDKKCLQMVRHLVKLGADLSLGMRNYCDSSSTITPIVYAMEQVCKCHDQEDVSLGVVDELLNSSSIEQLLDSADRDRFTKHTIVKFVAAIAQDLRIYPGVLMEAVKREYLGVIELFLKGSRKFKVELLEFQSRQGCKEVLAKELRLGKRTLSVKNIPIGSLPVSDAFRRYVNSVPEGGIYFVGRNVIFSTEQTSGEQLLSLAIYHKRLSIVRWLLENEVLPLNAPNKYGYTCMHFAAAVDCVEALELLFDAGMVPEEVKRMPFSSPAHVAASNCAIRALKFMNKKCPEILLKIDSRGHNVFHEAASSREDNVELMKYLVENVKGLSPDAPTDAKQGYSKVIEKTAKAKGADDIIDSRTSKVLEDVWETTESFGGYTPLHIAVQARNYRIAKFLIEEAGCDPEVKDPEGFSALTAPTDGTTLLHLAVRARDLNFVQKLLKYNSTDLNAQVHGQTPIDIAIANRDRLMANLLLADSRQNLVVLDRGVEVSYLQVLRSAKMLDDTSKGIFMQRVRKGRFWRNKATFLITGAFIGTVVFMASLIMFGDYILKLFKLGADTSLQVRSFVVFALILATVTVCIVFVCLRVDRNEKCLEDVLKASKFSEGIKGSRRWIRSRPKALGGSSSLAGGSSCAGSIGSTVSEEDDSYMADSESIEEGRVNDQESKFLDQESGKGDDFYSGAKTSRHSRRRSFERYTTPVSSGGSSSCEVFTEGVPSRESPSSILRSSGSSHSLPDQQKKTGGRRQTAEKAATISEDVKIQL